MIPLLLTLAALAEDPACDAQTDPACVEVIREGAVHARRIDGLLTTTIDDKGHQRTVVPLAQVLAPDTPEPHDDWQLKIYATDGFTHGGHATWINVEHGYLEVGTRRVVFTEDQGLSDTFRVRDAYRFELSRK